MTATLRFDPLPAPVRLSFPRIAARWVLLGLSPLWVVFSWCGVGLLLQYGHPYQMAAFGVLMSTGWMLAAWGWLRYPNDSESPVGGRRYWSFLRPPTGLFTRSAR